MDNVNNNYRLEFGKWKGTKICGVPRSYLRWLIQQKKEDLKLYQSLLPLTLDDEEKGYGKSSLDRDEYKSDKNRKRIPKGSTNNPQGLDDIPY